MANRCSAWNRMTASVFGTLVLVAGCSLESPIYSDAGVEEGVYDLEPPPEFWSPVSEDVLLFDMKGRINPGDAAYDEMKLGLGTFDAEGEEFSTSMGEVPIAYGLEYPADYTDQTLAGKNFVGLTAYEMIETSGKTMRFYHIRVGLPVDELVQSKAEGQNEVSAGGALVTVSDWSVYLKLNGLQLDRICPLALRDLNSSASKLFIDWEDNVDFSNGETIKAFGNIALNADQQAIVDQKPHLELHQNQYCEFALNGSPITAEQYDDEIANDTGTLTCDLPEEYLLPFADSHLALTFRGEISDALSQYPVYGTIDIDAEVDGAVYGANVYSAWSTLTGGDTSTATVTVSALSDVNEITPIHHKYVSTYLVFYRETLKQAKAEENHLIESASIGFASVSAVETIYEGDENSHLKFCPLGIIDYTDPDSTAYTCFENNSTFDIAEELELALNVALTSDPDAIAAYYTFFPGEECYCETYGTQTACADFPEEK